MVSAFTATIANGATESDEITCYDAGQLAALIIPGAFTGTSITFETRRESDGVWVPVYYDGSEYSVTVAADRCVSLEPNAFYALPVVRLVSNDSEGAERKIVAIRRQVS